MDAMTSTGRDQSWSLSQRSFILVCMTGFSTVEGLLPGLCDCCEQLCGCSLTNVPLLHGPVGVFAELARGALSLVLSEADSIELASSIS